jgi:hypothetical protein
MKEYCKDEESLQTLASHGAMRSICMTVVPVSRHRMSERQGDSGVARYCTLSQEVWLTHQTCDS